MADVCLNTEQLRRKEAQQSLKFVAWGESLMIAQLEVANVSSLRTFKPNLIAAMHWENRIHQLYWLALKQTKSCLTLLLLPIYAAELERAVLAWNSHRDTRPIELNIRRVGIDEAVRFYENAIRNDDLVRSGSNTAVPTGSIDKTVGGNGE